MPTGFQLKFRFEPTPGGQWLPTCRDCGEKAEIPYARSQARLWAAGHHCPPNTPTTPTQETP